VTAPSSPLRLRLVAPLAGLTLFALFAALYLGDRDLYVRIMGLWGVPAYRYPFLDWEGASAFIECWRRGIDVYVSDPCDVRGQVFNYSPLWLEARFVPFGPFWRNATGVGMAVTFFASLYLVFRPKSWGDTALFTLASLSTAVAYGVERANLDLMLFVMIVAAGVLAAGRLGQRWLAYGLILLAGLFKFYPLAALLTAVRERLAIFVGVAALAGAGLCIFVWTYRSQLAALQSNIPGGRYGHDAFGAANLLYLLPISSEAVRLALLATLAMCAFAMAVSIAREGGFARAFAAIGLSEQSLLVLGAAVIVGCFFAGQSILYRGVFLAPVVAGLIAMRRASDEAHVRRRLAWLTGVALLLMWEGAWDPVPGDSPAKTLYLIPEVMWWWVVASLTAVLLVWVAQSPALADLRRIFRPREARA